MDQIRSTLGFGCWHPEASSGMTLRFWMRTCHRTMWRPHGPTWQRSSGRASENSCDSAAQERKRCHVYPCERWAESNTPRRCVSSNGRVNSWYLENIVYHFFRQLWLVLGVKLREIITNLFSRYTNYCMIHHLGWSKSLFTLHMNLFATRLFDAAQIRLVVDLVSKQIPLKCMH